MTTTITVLDHLVVVNLDIHIWTARKKLVPLDLGGAELPPEDLASLGSKRICNPEDLRTFGTLKARAVNLLERNGIRFLSGWAVPETRMDAIGIELAAIRDEFNAAKESFLQRYEQSVQDWIAGIRNGATSLPVPRSVKNTFVRVLIFVGRYSRWRNLRL